MATRDLFPSANVENDVTDDFSALDDFVGGGNVVKRQAPGDRVDEASLHEQAGELGDSRRAIQSEMS